jgi:dolichol-phosphate mannosyltransferase
MPFFGRHLPLAGKFIKFCLVGGSGLVVDTVFLFLFADARTFGLNLVLSKILAAEIAMVNNFAWNELWTFRAAALRKRNQARPSHGSPGCERPCGQLSAETPAQDPQTAALDQRHPLFRRFLAFNLVCSLGIGIAVLLLHVFHKTFALNLYISNLLAIVLVTFWNFTLSLRLWKR